MPGRLAWQCGSETFRHTSSMTVWAKATDTLNQDGDLIRESWQVCLMFLLQRWIEHLLCSLAEDWKMKERGSLFFRSSWAGREG